MYSIILPLCKFILVAQVFASHNGTLNSEAYRSRPIEVAPVSKVVTTVEAEPLTKKPGVSFAPFSQSLATYTVRFEAACESKNGLDRHGRSWKFFFWSARCDTSTGNSRLMKITCSSMYGHRDGRVRLRRGRNRTFLFECPEDTVCRRVVLINTQGGPPLEEAACVDIEDVRDELVIPANSRADPHAPYVHCGLSLALPGTEFTVKPGVQSIDITLTEEARYKDGSPYPAPMLYIRDKTRWRGFDRVVRQDTSVASTQVTLTAVNGKFQTQIFDFCMQLSPGLTASAVKFTYAWFQTTSRHGRILKRVSLDASDDELQR